MILQEKLRREIMSDPESREFNQKGFEPLFTCSECSKIAIIGQAPGLKAQTKQIPWDDKSGEKLVEWLGITMEDLRNPDLFAILPMDFYYPGKGKSGDLPPRKGFAEKWHTRALDSMPDIKMIILVGSYAQKHYLGGRMKSNLTETVRAYSGYLPEFFPIVHPSPLNFRWQAKNSWFEAEVVPALRAQVAKILQDTH